MGSLVDVGDLVGNAVFRLLKHNGLASTRVMSTSHASVSTIALSFAQSAESEYNPGSSTSEGTRVQFAVCNTRVNTFPAPSTSPLVHEA